jgi:hypothetical protein
MGKKKKKHSKEGRRNTSKGGNRIIPSKRAQSHPLAWHARTVSCILVQCIVECSTDNAMAQRAVTPTPAPFLRSTVSCCYSLLLLTTDDEVLSFNPIVKKHQQQYPHGHLHTQRWKLP